MSKEINNLKRIGEKQPASKLKIKRAAELRDRIKDLGGMGVITSIDFQILNFSALSVGILDGELNIRLIRIPPSGLVKFNI